MKKEATFLLQEALTGAPLLPSQAQTLWSLYEKVRPSTLRLTKLDDEILQDMEESFPDLRVTESDKTGGVLKVDEEKMKSEKGKKAWRDFIQKYEGKGECVSRRDNCNDSVLTYAFC